MKIESYKVHNETKYRFRVFIGNDPVTGKQIRLKRSGFDTKKEAQQAYAELLAFYEPTKAKRLTYKQVYNLWIESYRPTVKDSTLRKTEQLFRDHILPYFGSMYLDEIKPMDCQRFVNIQSASAVRANVRCVYMAKIFDFAVENEFMDKSPAAYIKKPRKAKQSGFRGREINYYTKEQLNQFMKFAEERLSPLWYAFFRLLAYTGMRRGEALALEWSDLDGDIIHVHKTLTRNDKGVYISNTPKTDKSNREILIDEKTRELLEALDKTSTYIFPSKKGGIMPESQPVKQLHRVVDGTDLPYISPHGLRHTHCSLLFSSGASIPEVQDRLGHSDVKTTIEIYNHVYQQDKQKALDNFMRFVESDS